MIGLPAWSFAKVLLASVLWVVLTVSLAAAVLVGAYLQLRSQSQSAGSGGIGAVSFGVSEALVPILVLVVFGPPVGLLLTWGVLRRSDT